MRLNKPSKEIVMGNVILLNHCNKIGVDLKRLKKCNIERMGNMFVFVLSKENVPKSMAAVPLDIDIASQPDIVLIMKIEEDGKITFEETEKTIRILNV